MKNAFDNYSLPLGKNGDTRIMSKKLNIRQNYKLLQPYLWKEKKLLLFGLLLMIFVSLTHLIDPLILAHIVDVSVPNKDLNDMYRYAFFFIGLIFVSGIASYTQIIILSKLGLKVITDIKMKLFSHLMKISVSFFDNRPVGDFITKVENDSEKVRFLFSELSIRIIGNLLFFVGVIIVITYKSPDVSVWILLTITIIAIAYNYFMRFMGKIFKRVREKYSEVTAKINEYVQGMHVIQTFHKEDEAISIVEKTSAEKKLIETKASFIEYSVEGFFLFLIEYFMFILVIILIVPQIFDGTKSIGTLIIFSQYINRIIWPLIQLLENVMQIQKSMVSLTRIRELSELPVEDYYNNKLEIKSFEEEIEFKNVWFAYEAENWILKDVSFKVRKGEKVALVGPSGSGKTTTISLICGFYKYQKGEILIDGIPLNKLNIKKWRRKVGLILQDVLLFPGNVIENVRIYDDSISAEKVMESIKMVHAEKFFEMGSLQNIIAERGQNISQGEKQLLSFARALTFNPEIVIMDEATSSIDTVTERKIQDSMLKVLAGKTAMIVAHRLSSIIDADNIIYFKDGQIKNQGTHTQLMTTSPDYQNLVNLQFMGGHDE